MNANTDKVSAAQAEVDEVARKMTDNVKVMINNQNEVQDMEKNSNSIKDHAFEIQNQARRLEKEARKRQMRLYIIMAIIVLCIVLYFLVPLFASDDEEIAESE